LGIKESSRNEESNNIQRRYIMKLWYQSASSYRYEPAFDEYGRTLEEQCQRIVRPDTDVHVEGIEVMARDIVEQKSFQYYQKIQILNNMLRAEKEGYDAFVIGCTLDDAMEEGRSMLDIPVVGIAETGFHMAMMLGHLFAVVTNTMAFFYVFMEMTERYGVRSKYLPGPYICQATGEEIAMALKGPQLLMKKFEAAAEKAVDEGASVILPNPTYLATLAYKSGLTKIKDAVVLDTVSVAVKTAELLVDLKKIGIEPSRRIGVYAKPGKELRKETFKRFKKVFKIED
jgi:allantoin racemase